MKANKTGDGQSSGQVSVRGSHPRHPRPLARAREACTRCRAKKTKCDSKHPKCTACDAAGVVCAQHDRLRNTVTPRGHLENIEVQLAQCQLLLQRCIPGFNLNDLDIILAHEGIGAQSIPNVGSYAQACWSPGLTIPNLNSIHSNRARHHDIRQLPLAALHENPNDKSNRSAPEAQFGDSTDVMPSQVIGNLSGSTQTTSCISANMTPSFGTALFGTPIDIWLPEDRIMANDIVNIYFSRLNPHRPVVIRDDFDKALDRLYASQMTSTTHSSTYHDPGFLCTFYLVLALGTLSKPNSHLFHTHVDPSSWHQFHVAPPDWPDHDQLFKRALSVKSDTISSLQALILLHWYLQAERLVGSLVRLSIELGLHQDPANQINPTTKRRLFGEEECILRTNLWVIVLIHDRATSLVLGRPLNIVVSDFSTPRPSQSNSHSDFSKHFELSHVIAEIEADIINSLHSPTHQPSEALISEALMRNAKRIFQKLSKLRGSLRSMDDTDEGLRLLKIEVAQLHLLRALFCSPKLNYWCRHKALVDAIVTSHNVIMLRTQLIRFPDIGFFTCLSALYIAATVIVYGQISRCGCLTRQTAAADVWRALEMLPQHWRSRWEGKNISVSRPLIYELAIKVMSIDLGSIQPVISSALLPEPEWDDYPTIPSSLPDTAAERDAARRIIDDISTVWFFPDEDGMVTMS
ncbi:Zn(2)-C6 fungal-type domain-containing protein [Favolaschia claudopus]|uniref:Zn(2)-C6 fungal-type domain-containing protein n=1 Tax=Favolaschia claudopus TaxID=2862362 RepID=A0AAV9ZK39_9AGAR